MTFLLIAVFGLLFLSVALLPIGKANTKRRSRPEARNGRDVTRT